MSLTASIYSSTDAGAPALSGTAGSLTALLDAILVDGYGSGPGLKSGLGWTKPYSGTNKRVYRNNPTTGTGYHVRVDDSAAIGNARHALVRAYETMSDVDTGTGPTPTVAQLANGIIYPKSTLLSSTARPWWVIGNERSVYLFIDINALGMDFAQPFFLGDYVSLRPGDVHNFMLSQAPLATWSGSSSDTVTYMLNVAGAGFGTAPVSSGAMGYTGRNYAQAPGPVLLNGSGTPALTTSNISHGSSGAIYPFAVNNGLLYDHAYLNEFVNGPRGYLPGLYSPLHNRPFTDQYQFTDIVGQPAGTTFVAKNFRSRVSTGGFGQSDGQVLFDTFNNW
jgi:hypothetical protein